MYMALQFTHLTGRACRCFMSVRDPLAWPLRSRPAKRSVSRRSTCAGTASAPPLAPPPAPLPPLASLPSLRRLARDVGRLSSLGGECAVGDSGNRSSGVSASPASVA